jgi:hypothetical protein
MAIKTTEETAGNMIDPFKPEENLALILNCAWGFVKATRSRAIAYGPAGRSIPRTRGFGGVEWGYTPLNTPISPNRWEVIAQMR